MSVERAVAKAAIRSQIDESEEGCNCECNQKTFPNIMCGLGMGAGAACVTTAVLGLLQIPAPSGFMLDLYCIGMGLLAFLAEARRFRVFRGLIYRIVKHVYFITDHTARSFYYMFVATIIFDDTKMLNIIVAIFIFVVGCMLLFINLMYKLPIYYDAEELKRMKEEAIRQEVEAKYQAAAAARAEAGAAAAGVRDTAHDAYQQYHTPKNETYAGNSGAAAADSHQSYADSRPAYESNPYSHSDSSNPYSHSSSGGGGGGGRPDDDPFAADRREDKPYQPPHML